MSNINTARRTKVRLKVEGVDITADINKDLISFTYTDYAEDNADDIRIMIDDRDGKWLGEWLNSSPETPSQNGSDADGYKIGDIVYFNGGTHFLQLHGNGTEGRNKDGGILTRPILYG